MKKRSKLLIWNEFLAGVKVRAAQIGKTDSRSLDEAFDEYLKTGVKALKHDPDAYKALTDLLGSFANTHEQAAGAELREGGALMYAAQFLDLDMKNHMVAKQLTKASGQCWEMSLVPCEPTIYIDETDEHILKEHPDLGETVTRLSKVKLHEAIKAGRTVKHTTVQPNFELRAEIIKKEAAHVEGKPS